MGHNFLLEGPIDLRTMCLNYILQDIFRDTPLDHIWDLIDVTLACKGANSKIFEVVTVGQYFEVDVQANFEAGVWLVFCR